MLVRSRSISTLTATSVLQALTIIRVTVSLCLCVPESQRQSDSHPRGPGQPGEQPVCEIQQHCPEDSHELETFCSQRCLQRLRGDRFTGLQEHH